jgi:hypothetical protein
MSREDGFIVLVYEGNVMISQKEFASYNSAFKYAATMCGGFAVEILHPNGDIEEVI